MDSAIPSSESLLLVGQTPTFSRLDGGHHVSIRALSLYVIESHREPLSNASASPGAGADPYRDFAPLFDGDWRKRKGVGPRKTTRSEPEKLRGTRARTRQGFRSSPCSVTANVIATPDLLPARRRDLAMRGSLRQPADWQSQDRILSQSRRVAGFHKRCSGYRPGGDAMPRLRRSRCSSSSHSAPARSTDGH